MKSSIHHLNPTKKPILIWSVDNLSVILTDSHQHKVLCEFQIRTHHNGRKLLSPEIVLPETQAVADVGFTEVPFPISQHLRRADSA